MSATEPIAYVRRLVESGRAAEAAKVLVASANGGDPTSLAELAEWSISGNVIPRNLTAARTFFAKAAEAGDAASALLLSYFLASGSGGEVDWQAAVAMCKKYATRLQPARDQLRLLDRMKLDVNGQATGLPALRMLHDDPLIQHASGFVSPDEADYLASAAAPYLQPSLVVDQGTGRMIKHPVRDSDGAIFGVRTEDLVVAAINRRIALLTSTDYRQGEPLQLLRYRQGGQYRPHMDGLPQDEPNQRVITAIIYLNDDYEGGQTVFPQIGISIRGKVGDVLIFRNTDAQGRVHPRSLHAGAPVKRGTKLIATRWIRAAPFTYPPPHPLLARLPV